MKKERLSTLFWRGCRLRCPLCGQGKLFKGFFRMRDSCEHCGVVYEREGGFFLGSIYFNYGLTALITAIAYPVLLFKEILPEQPLMWISALFVVAFPVWFFRYARSFWLGFDHFIDPREDLAKTGEAKAIARDEPKQEDR